MNIIYLYTEIMPYVTVVFEELSKMGHNVYAFNKYKQTPYIPNQIENVSYYELADFSKYELLEKVKSFNPNIILCCGWNEDKYLYVSRYYKKHTDMPIVCPIDTQYIGRFKQIIGILTAPFYIKKYFTHMWVPGVRQYHFATLLGFKPKNIIMNSLTGRVDLFKSASIEHKRNKYPKSFLFVGRYHHVKGLDILLQAWDKIQDKLGWTITLVGNGPLKDELYGRKDIIVKDFMSQDDLVKLSEISGVFVLPSIYEPWALVLHEFAASGLPILCSDACGAASHLVINGYNGHTFESGNVYDLYNKMSAIIKYDDNRLYSMGTRSRELSLFTNPQLSAVSLLSVVNNCF